MDLSEAYEKYPNQWCCLTDEGKVISHADSCKEALRLAEGYTMPTLLYTFTGNFA